MRLTLGEKIKELRKRYGRKQEDLANALDVSSQAVSRWEKEGSYPDIELIPAIANYFGISIDELFGYENDREKKIVAIIRKVEEYDIHNNDDIESVEECIMLLRDGLAEFPNNEDLLITLAEILWEAGWLKHDNWLGYGKDGYIQYNYDIEKKNKHWLESAKICEKLIERTCNNTIFTRAITILVPLYRNFGDFDRAKSFAMRMPKLIHSREYLLTEATDGKFCRAYIGEFLLETARQFSEQLVFLLISDTKNFDSGMPIDKVQGAISLFDLLCEDGNMGKHHDFISKLYMYLSALQWKMGYRDDAFTSLDKALEHAKMFEKLFFEDTHEFTAPLVKSVKYDIGKYRNVVKTLPDEFPYYRIPDSSRVKTEMMSDSRWKEWVEKTQ